MLIYSGLWALSLMITGVITLDLADLLSFRAGKQPGGLVPQPGLPGSSSLSGVYTGITSPPPSTKAASERHETRSGSHQLPGPRGRPAHEIWVCSVPDQAQASPSFTHFSARQKHVSLAARTGPQHRSASPPPPCAQPTVSGAVLRSSLGQVVQSLRRQLSDDPGGRGGDDGHFLL